MPGSPKLLGNCSSRKRVRAANEAVLEHLGREFFFDKHDRDRQTKAPDLPAPRD